MRVSERQRYEVTGQRIERAKAENSSALEILSSQKRINKISDDPIGLAQSIRESSKISEFRQLQKNISFSQGFLERSETALGGIHDNLIRAKELSVLVANDTYGPDSRQATSREVAQIINEVVSLANTTYGNRFVFSGFRTQTPSLDPENGYIGDDGALFLQIDRDNFHQINLQARFLFEATPEEREAKHMGMVDTLNILNEGLRTNDKTMLHKAIDELDYQLSKASSYQATIGARAKSLEDSLRRIQMSEDLSTEAISRVRDADTFQATSDFKRSETVLQSTLLASNKLLQPSLLNFMQ